jgi:CHAT domain-containing protein
MHWNYFDRQRTEGRRAEWRRRSLESLRNQGYTNLNGNHHRLRTGCRGSTPGWGRSLHTPICNPYSLSWHYFQLAGQTSLIKKTWNYIGLGLITAALIILGFASGNLATASQRAHLPLATEMIVSTTAAATVEGKQWLDQGRAEYQAGHFAAAIVLWQKAVQSFRDQNDHPHQAIALSNLALAYHQLGQGHEANQAIAESLRLIENPTAAIGNPQILAQALMTQGKLELAQGRAELALTTWRRATTAYEQAGDSAGSVRSLIQQSQALRVMGLHLQARERLEQAQAALQNQPDSALKAAVLLNLGDTLRLMGNLPQSKAVLQQSLSIYAHQPIRSRLDVAAVQLSLGNTAYAQLLKLKNTNPTQPTEAIQTLSKEAWKNYEQAGQEAADALTQLQAQLNQLRLLIETNARSQALALADRLRSPLINLPASRTAIYAQVDFGQSLLKLERQGTTVGSTRLSETAKLLAIAHQQSRQLGDKQAESYALGYLGQFYQQTRQWQEAQQLTEQALLLAQATNASEVAYRWQWQIAQLLAQQGKQAEAVQVYAAAIHTLNRVRKELVGSNLDVQFSFRESVEPIYRQFVELLLSDQANVSQENLKQARDVIESLQLAELDNFFQEACLNAKAIEIDQIDRRAAVFYPIILPDRLEVILALPGHPLRHYATVMPQTELEAKLALMRQSLARTSSKQERLAIAQQLYGWLIRPAESALAGADIQTLTFVLDGSLRSLPMAALHDGQRYLVEKYSLGLTPGLQLRQPKPIDKPQLKALLGGVTESRQDFPPLPGVQVEVNDIHQQLPAEVLLNQRFTRAALQNQVQATPFPIVHLATHGQFSSDAENTFILTWDDRVNAKQLGDLLRQRQQGDRYPIELLVLSACQTAQGDTRAALGLAGLAVRSGARSTLAALWSVDDQSTTLLMTRFYRELLKPGVTKAEALRRAQLSLLQGEIVAEESQVRGGVGVTQATEPETVVASRAASEFSHPYYWAPFVLVGDWL